MVKSVVLAAVAAVGLMGVAFAQVGGCTAIVGHVTGSLLVNHGDGFHDLLPHSVLHAGDIVMASGSGSGVVRFSDGSIEQVLRGSAVRVPGNLPCNSLSGYQTPFRPTVAADPSLNLGLVAAGVVGVAGVVAVVVASQKSSPVSP